MTSAVRKLLRSYIVLNPTKLESVISVVDPKIFITDPDPTFQ
jgi:hypothetical protein